jgi:uncharacterized protein DUF6079
LHELEWRERHASRLGYLFFGAPNERPTAYPPRDFCLYFVPPLRPPEFRDEKKADEVLFRLTRADDAFNRALRMYDAALELEGAASSQTRSVYRDKAQGFLRTLVNWLQENMATGYEVTYRGTTKALVEWAQGRLSVLSGARTDVRDLINTVASTCLANEFDLVAPRECTALARRHTTRETDPGCRLERRLEARAICTLSGGRSCMQGSEPRVLASELSARSNAISPTSIRQSTGTERTTTAGERFV